MAEIRPLRGLRYNLKKTDLARVLAPPYDVISREKREELLARDPHNVIRLILGDPGTFPPKERSDSARYREAAHTLTRWCQEKILEEDPEPSVYLLRDTFEWRGEPRERIGILTTVRLQEFGKGEVFPHERTLALPIEDRLNLTRATRTHLSPVYMLFDDPAKDATAWIRGEMSKTPLQTFSNQDEKITHALWRVSEPKAVRTVIQLLRPRSLLIADGHHRYTTALHYARTEGMDNPEAGWTLAFASPCPSDGVVCSAIHRAVTSALTEEELLGRLRPSAEISAQALSWGDFERGKAPLALLSADRKTMHGLRFKEDSRGTLPAELSEVPSALLNELVLGKELGLDLSKPGDQERVRFVKNPEEIAGDVRPGELRFWLAPLDPVRVLELARKGQVLPQKSTFFYPKVMTGFVLHPFG